MSKEKSKAKHIPHKHTPVKNTTGYTANRWVMGGVLTAILLITYSIYAPVADYGFTNWDDDVYVTENPIIAHPGDTKLMLTTPVGGNYHPLTMYSLAYDYAQTAELPMEQKAGRFHAVNVFFHLLNVLLVFYFVYLFSAGRTTAAYICALFFAIHPMHVESVAWVAERKDVLYAFFFFISLICYVLYLDKRKYLWLLLCLVAFVLSMAAKPAAVILPLVLVAIDIFRQRKFDMQVIGEKLPFFLLSLAAGILTIQAQKASGAVGSGTDYTLLERSLFPFYGSMMYFIKLLWPFHLSALYPFPNIKGQSLGFEFYIAPVVVAATLGTLLYFGKGKRIVLFGLLFFFANVILILQFFNVGQAIIAERYTYVAYVGPFMMLAWWLDEEQVKNNKSLYYGLLAGIALLTVIYLTQSFDRVKVWKDNETLWTDVIEKFPRRVSDAYNNRGYHYRHTGQPDKALADYDIALQMNPTDEQVWSNRGNIYFDKGMFDSAIANYNRAVSYKDGLWETLSNRGASRAQVGDLAGAVQDLELSTSHDSGSVSSLNNLSLVYSMMGQHEKAIATYSKSMRLSPQPAIANGIGVEYQQLNRHTDAVSAFSKAIDLASNVGLYYLNRSISYNAMGDRASAIRDMQTAQKLGAKVPPEYAAQLGS